MPPRDDQCRERGLSGEIRIDIRSDPSSRVPRSVQAAEQLPHLSLTPALQLHVRVHRNKSRGLTDGARLLHPHHRAEARFRRQAIVIREEGPPRACPGKDGSDLGNGGEIGRLVIQAGRDAEATCRESGLHECAHARDLVRRCAMVGGARNRRPDAVEGDAGRHRRSAVASSTRPIPIATPTLLYVRRKYHVPHGD